MDAASTEAKIAAVAVAFTSFSSTLDGGMRARGKQSAASANARAIRKEGIEQGKQKRRRVVFAYFACVVLKEKACRVAQTCGTALEISLSRGGLNGRKGKVAFFTKA
jgi:hypothetical protein